MRYARQQLTLGILIGTQAMRAATGASEIVAVGGCALYNNTGGSNTAVGWQGLYNNTSGNNNTVLGNAAMYTNLELVIVTLLVVTMSLWVFQLEDLLIVVVIIPL